MYFKPAYLEAIAKKAASSGTAVKAEGKERSKTSKELEFNVLNSQFLNPSSAVNDDSSGEVITVEVNWKEIIFHIVELANDLISLEKTNHIQLR